MTSNFARSYDFSQRTYQAYSNIQGYGRGAYEFLNFYLHYFAEVAPSGVTIHHIPSDQSGVQRPNTREEIQLRTPWGEIFMSGLVSLEGCSPVLETVAGNEAYTKWLDGDFISDDRNWRFFIAYREIKLFKSHDGDEWACEDVFRPMVDAEQVAAFLPQEYDALVSQRLNVR